MLVEPHNVQEVLFMGFYGSRITHWYSYSGISLVAQTVKNLPAMQETWVQSLSWEDLPEWEWQPTPVFLPEEFHGQRSLGLMGLQRVVHNWVTKTHTHTHTFLLRQPSTPPCHMCNCKKQHSLTYVLELGKDSRNHLGHALGNKTGLSMTWYTYIELVPWTNCDHNKTPHCFLRMFVLIRIPWLQTSEVTLVVEDHA